MEDKSVYTREEVVSGLRILVDKLDELENKRNYCAEHKFNYEKEVIQAKIDTLSEVRSKIKIHFGLLGEYIRPTRAVEKDSN